MELGKGTSGTYLFGLNFFLCILMHFLDVSSGYHPGV